MTVVAVSWRQFEVMVRRACDVLPDEFQERMVNVVVRAEDAPSPELLRELELGPNQLFGLYQGSPWADHASGYALLPGVISIYRRSIEAACATLAEVEAEVYRTLVHEVGHYFGLDEAELAALEARASHSPQIRLRRRPSRYARASRRLVTRHGTVRGTSEKQEEP